APARAGHRQDHRRPPLVARPQAGRDIGRTALPHDGARCWRAPGRAGAGETPMRKRLAVMAAATTSMVVIAFVLPLAFLLRDLASQRAVTKAVLESQSLVSVLAAVDAGSRPGVVESLRAHTSDEVPVFLPNGTVLG